MGVPSECNNCAVGEHCGVLMHGRAVTFCEPLRRARADHCSSQHNHCLSPAVRPGLWLLPVQLLGPQHRGVLQPAWQ
ncbi:hypothetical protein CRUP_033541 [Coryphaenoides rupestris]|nr:hypothetical protein CRUP_033541 [Coryphaenoides rupestris]